MPFPPITPSGHDETQCGPSCRFKQTAHLSAPCEKMKQNVVDFLNKRMTNRIVKLLQKYNNKMMDQCTGPWQVKLFSCTLHSE